MVSKLVYFTFTEMKHKKTIVHERKYAHAYITLMRHFQCKNVFLMLPLPFLKRPLACLDGNLHKM